MTIFAKFEKKSYFGNQNPIAYGPQATSEFLFSQNDQICRFQEQPELWALSFAGQFVCSVGNIFLFVLPAVISAVWFPESELAIASAIGAGGLITGNALGYVIPTIIVKGPVDTYGTSNYPANWADKKAYPDKYEAAQVIFLRHCFNTF